MSRKRWELGLEERAYLAGLSRRADKCTYLLCGTVFFLRINPELKVDVKTVRLVLFFKYCKLLLDLGSCQETWVLGPLVEAMFRRFAIK